MLSAAKHLLTSASLLQEILRFAQDDPEFVIRHSELFRHSSFVIRHFSGVA
jgi:hypothetical protein